MKKREKSLIYRRLLQSYLSSVISISLVLLLAGLTALLAVNTKSVSDYFRENIKLSLIFNDNTDELVTMQVLESLRSREYVKEALYISQEQGTNEMKEILGEDFLEIFEVNPIPISIDLFLKAQYIESDSLVRIERELSSMPMVREVAYQESLVKIINDNMERAGVVIGVFMLLLLFISFVLINNTIRLNLFAKRFTIQTMKLVGARRPFIRRPLLIKGFMQGAISGVIALSMLWGVVFLIKRDLPELYLILDVKLIMMVYAGIFIAGILLCVISTYFIVNRLVSMSGDDIYY